MVKLLRRHSWGSRTIQWQSFLSKVDLSGFDDPVELENILAYVDQIAPDSRAVKASVDIVLQDLVGKIMQQPWYKIWGLDPSKTLNTSYTIRIDTPEVVRQKVKETAPYKILNSLAKFM